MYTYMYTYIYKYINIYYIYIYIYIYIYVHRIKKEHIIHLKLQILFSFSEVLSVLFLFHIDKASEKDRNIYNFK